MNGVWLGLFAIAAGFTASAIVASLYRCAGISFETHSGKIVAAAVLLLAGPSVMFRMAANGLRRRKLRPLVGWLVMMGLSCWSLAIGLLILDIVSGR